DAEEKYGLHWHGKRRARQLALTPSTGTLRPCPEDSVEWATTKNLMIEGDNLEVLKLLQKSYAGKVKLIYIDPPYNTGKDFVYPDDFQDNIANYQRLTGQTDAGGLKTSSNTESSGRFHTDWLNMMYPRLKLAWALLDQNGAMFFSIDEKELHHLRAVANELFGEENFVADVTVVTNLKGRNDKKHVAACHEHIVIYAKPSFVSIGLPLTEEQRAAYKYRDEQDRPYALRDLRKRGGPDKREDRPRMFFPIYWNPASRSCSLERKQPEDVEIFPYRGDGSEGRWRWGSDKVRAHLPWMHPKHSTKSGRWDVEHRVYLDPAIRIDAQIVVDDDEEEDEEDEVFERTSKPKSIWLGGEFSTDSGKRALKRHLPGDTFDFPKSVELLKRCVQLVLGQNGVVIDLFAGSGTLGEALFTHNAQTDGRGQLIAVQLPEVLDPNEKDQKAAADFCDQLGKPRTIAELTKERLRRAGAKIRAEWETKQKAAAEQADLLNPAPVAGERRAPDVGFRVFKLASSNIREWDPQRDRLAESLEAAVDHLKTDRTEQDILYELLLKLGLDLCVPIETRPFAGHVVSSVGAGSLLVCLSPKIAAAEVETLALGIVAWHKELKPAGETTVVFRDSAFADDIAKTNLAAILQQHGLETVRSL
ncbi:MAG TPA: site-specific DNA-methyltransferase, partial [Opitutaceae bacterium]|nr:site-specific DNA-methyltransferase [Opitutaceae bacterium]